MRVARLRRWALRSRFQAVAYTFTLSESEMNMNSIELYIELKPGMSSRIKNIVSNVIGEDTARTAGRINSYACTHALSEGAKQIDQEISNVFSKISGDCKRIRDVKAFKELLYQFICEEYAKMSSYISSGSDDDFTEKNGIAIVDVNRKKDSCASLIVLYNAEVKRRKDKKNGKQWEIAKILIGAILGSMLTIIVQKLLRII